MEVEMQVTPQLITHQMANPQKRFAFGRNRDLELAGRAVIYLEKHGLDRESVVRCLIEEFELDRETAKAVVALAA
jgi:hypothetical protein